LKIERKRRRRRTTTTTKRIRTRIRRTTARTTTRTVRKLEAIKVINETEDARVVEVRGS